MTGLLNKTATRQHISAALTLNPEKKYAFFILDIDNFKQANDLHGHDFGDYVIIRFTDIMKSNFRTDDILGRIGGDEFVVFTFGESEKQIEDDIESIKNDIEKQGYSISYGVSFSEVSTNAERFIKQAERNMLDNKYSYYHKKSVENNKDGDWTISLSLIHISEPTRP